MSIDIGDILNYARWSSILNFPEFNIKLSNDEIISDWILELGCIIGSFYTQKGKIEFIDSILSRLECIHFLRKLDNTCEEKSLKLFNHTRMNLVRGSLRRRRESILHK